MRSSTLDAKARRHRNRRFGLHSVPVGCRLRKLPQPAATNDVIPSMEVRLDIPLLRATSSGLRMDCYRLHPRGTTLGSAANIPLSLVISRAREIHVAIQGPLPRRPTACRPDDRLQLCQGRFGCQDPRPSCCPPRMRFGILRSPCRTHDRHQPVIQSARSALATTRTLVC
jgi:hypothetical protein